MGEKLKNSIWLIVLTGLVNIVFVLLGVWEVISPASVVIIIGVFSFFSTLALTSYFSEKQNFLEGEMRKAIATSLLMVYFAILALTLVDPNATLAVTDMTSDGSRSTLMSDFSTIIMVVIGFYFGGRSAEEIIKNWKS
jgi:predicted neutral ceramidase superfamily lipid hydrolase